MGLLIRTNLSEKLTSYRQNWQKVHLESEGVIVNIKDKCWKKNNINSF